MRSGGSPFGKSTRSDVVQTAHPPNHAAIVELLKIAQKQAERQASLSWPAGQDGSRHILNVNLVPSVQRGDRRQWSSLSKNAEIKPGNEPEWTLFKELGGVKTELFTMRSTDSALVLNMLAQSTDTFRPTGSANEPTLANVPAMQPATEPHRTYSQMRQYTPPAEVPPESQSGALSLSGNLKDVDLPSILQSIGLCKMTGKLRVFGSAHMAEIFFDDGELVHATSSHAVLSDQQLTGDPAVVDLFTWDEGGFQFQPGWKSEVQTVKKKIHSLMLEGAALSDYKTSLEKSGVMLDTMLCRVDAKAMSEEEMEKRLKEGLPIHKELHKELYEILEKPQTLQQLLDQKHMPKGIYVPVMFNLINLKLIQIAGGQSENVIDDEFANVEDLMAHSYMALIEPSGLMKYAHFLLLARSELTRYQATEIPFSIAIVHFESVTDPLTDAMLATVADCFYRAGQPVDILACKNSQRLFFLMPHSEETIAANTMKKFLKELFTATMPNGGQGSALQARIGIASVPLDGEDFVVLLTRANQRRVIADESQPIVNK